MVLAAVAALVGGSPLQGKNVDLSTVPERMNKLFEDVMRTPYRPDEGLSTAAWAPAVDIYETDKEYAFELEVPGFAEKELSVEVTDHTLVVKGEQLETKEETDKQYRLHERLERTFERRFTLPLEADTTKVGAEFTKGVLTVHAPKVNVPKPRKVEIAAKK